MKFPGIWKFDRAWTTGLKYKYLAKIHLCLQGGPVVRRSVSQTYTLFRLVTRITFVVSLLRKSEGQLKPSLSANSLRPVIVRSWSVSLFQVRRSPVVRMPQRWRPSSVRLKATRCLANCGAERRPTLRFVLPLRGSIWLIRWLSARKSCCFSWTKYVG